VSPQSGPESIGEWVWWVIAGGLAALGMAGEAGRRVARKREPDMACEAGEKAGQVSKDVQAQIRDYHASMARRLEAIDAKQQSAEIRQERILGALERSTSEIARLATATTDLVREIRTSRRNGGA